MKLFQKKEARTEEVDANNVDDVLLRSLLQNESISRENALQVPSVTSAISLIASTIASTEIKLYKMVEDSVVEVNDYRISLLNDETGDTLNTNNMWKAVVEDYFLGKGAYIYINKELGKLKSLHYVEEKHIAIMKNEDPIFKSYTINVNGKSYLPHQFIKILRNTKDGSSGVGITTENSLVLSVAYQSLVYEENLVKKGGNKRGFLKAKKALSKDAMDALKSAFRKLYKNNEENVVVLNDGLEFQESASTLVEMQLNENKTTNGSEIGKILHVSPNLMNGSGASVKPEQEINKFIRLAVIPVMKVIETALNTDLLLEKEKGSFYFAFDTKELLKGSMEERFKAYKDAVDSKIMMIDEVRQIENLEKLGLDFLNLGLGDVLYNPKTKDVFTPNTGESANLGNLKGGETNED